jgi:hypothetical protein
MENDGTRELNVCSILFNGFHHERSTLNFHQCPSGEGHLQISVVQMLVTLEEPVADVAGSSSVHPADSLSELLQGQSRPASALNLLLLLMMVTYGHYH